MVLKTLKNSATTATPLLRNVSRSGGCTVCAADCTEQAGDTDLCGDGTKMRASL